MFRSAAPFKADVSSADIFCCSVFTRLRPASGTSPLDLLMTSPFRLRRRAALVALAVAATSLVATPVWSAPAATADPAPTTVPTSVVSPPTSVEPPDSSVPTTTTLPGPTTTTLPGPTTSTLPGDTTTITTLPTDATLPESQTGSTWIQPVIPDVESDPVFHAARKVDAATVKVEEGEKAVADARRRESGARRRFARVEEVRAGAARRAKAADDEVTRSRTEVRNAAMRSYMGYGGDTGVVDESAVQGANDPKAVSRAYLSVTAGEARERLSVGLTRQSKTHGELAVATRDADRSRSARDDASGGLGDAYRDLLEANRDYLKARKELVDAVQSAPDFGPGSLALLPTDVGDGATTVPSPAGLIVLPKGTDPRTGYALAFVVAQIGKPYVWGATGPGTYDCSGLMLRAWASVGVSIPRVSQAQQASVTPVAAKDLRPGDLVFFGTPAYHVGMYIGGGLMLNAPYTGSVVRVDRVWSTVSSFGRVLPATTDRP